MQLEDTKQFRQLHSKTPGHPENFITDGVEVTTGHFLLPDERESWSELWVWGEGGGSLCTCSLFAQ